MYIGLNNLGLSGLRGSFSPSSLFAGSGAGVWLDDTDLSTLYQDSAGTTPVTTASQPVGLMLDKHLGLALASNLVTPIANSNFSSDTGFWTKDTGVTISGGSANWTAAAANVRLYVNGLLTSGKEYEFTYTITSYTSGGVAIGFGTTESTTTRSAIGTYTERIVTDGTQLAFSSVGTLTTLSISNVSVREVTGNHFLQATTTTRPLYNVSPSRMTFDGVDDNLATSLFLAGTLSNNMDCTMLVNLSKVTSTLLGYMTQPSGFFGVAVAGDNSGCMNSVGAAWSVFVNGIQIGGVNTTTRAQLNAALAAGTWQVVEFRNMDLSTWTQFSLGGYSGFTLQGNITGLILCSAQTNSVRQQIRTWLGAKVGLTL